MSEQFRLVYSGEVLDGQHAAVVKKRLAGVLKLDDDRMDVLFSGKAVVVKRATDEKTAARYQQVFTKAGARLRVLPVEDEDTAADSQSTASPAQTPVDQPPAGADSGLQVMPVGSDMLTAAERPTVEVADVPTDHLSVADDRASDMSAGSTVASPAGVEVPSVDHLTLAELGAHLGTQAAKEIVVAEIDAEFDLAEVGAILGQLEETITPPAPSTDHLTLDEPPPDKNE